MNQQADRTGNYFLTLLIELFFGLFRVILLFFLIFIPTGVYYWSIDWSFPPDYRVIASVCFFFALVIGYSTIISSWFSYMGAGGGSQFTRFALGARIASSREMETLQQVYKQMVDQVDFPITGFTMQYIIDSPMEHANVIGTTLYISSGAIRSTHLPAMLAHELGHLHHGDGGVILALRRLIFPLFYLFIGGIRDFSTQRPAHRPEVKEFDAEEIYYAMVNKVLFFLFAFWGGGLGVWFMSWNWANYFRQRDYEADAFVVKLGYKDELLEYLEQYKFFDSAVPYMLGWRPAHELRIDQILNPTFSKQVKKSSGEGKVTIRPFIEEESADYKISISLQEAFLGTHTTIQTKAGKRITSKVPRGVTTGNAIIRDDLGKVFIRVTDDPDFERRQNDLYVTLMVSKELLEQGGEVEVEAMDGAVKLQVPSETPNSTVFRLRGKGMPILGKPEQRGNLLVTLSCQPQREVEENLTPSDPNVPNKAETDYTEMELKRQTKAWLVEKMQELSYPLPTGGKGALKNDLIQAFIVAQDTTVPSQEQVE